MSVSLNIRQVFGEANPRTIAALVSTELSRMEYDADEMGVTLDWSRIYLTVGADYDEYETLRGLRPRRSPYLEIKVPGERKNDE